MKAGVFASPNRNLIYVRKDQTVACTTLYPSTWPGMKARYSEKRDEVELCGYVFVRVADVPNGCTKPHLHLQDVAANLRVPYVHRDENGEPLKLQPFVAATIDAPYMKVDHHRFNEGPSFPSNGLVHQKTVTGRSLIANDPPPQNITRTFTPAYLAPGTPTPKIPDAYQQVASDFMRTVVEDDVTHLMGGKPRSIGKSPLLGAPYGPGLRVWEKMVALADAGKSGRMNFVDLPDDMTVDQAREYARQYRQTYPALADVFVGFLSEADKELLRNQVVSAEFGALGVAADKAAESMHSFVEAACGETREESEASWAAAAEMGPVHHTGGVLSSAEKAEPFGVAQSEYLLPIDEVKHFEQGVSIGAQLADRFSEEIEIRVLAQQALIGDGTSTEFRIKSFPIHGRPLHPQMKKVGITGLVVDPDKPEQMEAVNDLFAGRIALCSAKAARKHRKQGHRVWFHPLFKAYAWSKESVA